ncbi:YbjN domain-containing protein [Rhodophyticola porphyridii]|uniref:YbjN domain-containing protein n=1 Tax=Rhodophyticola porphyridii TaxID=1852017 RepID=A0A3L9YH68_9RHOB|nr:YbjN domain-containing protein [Rhodophyticola porphyridii]RMA42170.1 YbjN domain-containing protein [Rhodophyticola porphyridii]
MTRLALFALPFALLTTATLAQDAAPPAQLGTDPGAILEVARGFGAAQMEAADRAGRPLVTGMLNGTRYGVLMYGCDEGDGCDSVQFFATFSESGSTLEFLNQWNADKRFGSAYLQEDGDVILHYSTSIRYGVNQRNFEDTFDVWQVTLNQFVNRLSGLPDDAAR